jgi:hypothetical protein
VCGPPAAEPSSENGTESFLRLDSRNEFIASKALLRRRLAAANVNPFPQTVLIDAAARSPSASRPAVSRKVLALKTRGALLAIPAHGEMAEWSKATLC